MSTAAKPRPDAGKLLPAQLRSGPIYEALKAVASMRIAVVVLALGVFLVYAGTLAQVDKGIWNVVSTYFHSFWVLIPIDSLAPGTLETGKFLPFPGGWTLGGVMLLNLLAAFVVRLKWTWRGSGLIISHFGIVVLLVGEVVTGVYAHEGNMSISEGSWSNYTVDSRAPELVFIDHTDPQKDTVVAIPRDWLVKGETIRDPRLPLDLQVDTYMTNSVLRTASGRPPRGEGEKFGAFEAPEVAGTNAADAIDMPSAYITLIDKASGRKLGTRLTSTWLNQGEMLGIGERQYEMALRFKRRYRPYRLHLKDFSVKRHLGTAIPSSFTSEIRLVDEERQVDRELSIWMNHPLRYRGETYYQASFRPDERGTVLQVVRNPGWLLPYVATGLVTLGMLIHFLLNLSRFIRRRSA